MGHCVLGSCKPPSATVSAWTLARTRPRRCAYVSTFRAHSQNRTDPCRLRNGGSTFELCGRILVQCTTSSRTKQIAATAGFQSTFRVRCQQLELFLAPTTHHFHPRVPRKIVFRYMRSGALAPQVFRPVIPLHLIFMMHNRRQHSVCLPVHNSMLISVSAAVLFAWILVRSDDQLVFPVLHNNYFTAYFCYCQEIGCTGRDRTFCRQANSLLLGHSASVQQLQGQESNPHMLRKQRRTHHWASLE